MTDYAVIDPLEMQWKRTQALKLAVKTFDQDAAINVLELMGVAQTILAYIMDGTIPQPITGRKTNADREPERD